MRSSSRVFQRTSSSTLSPPTGGRSSSAASTDIASGSVSTTRESDRLTPVTATVAATRSGLSAKSLAASGPAATRRSRTRRLSAGDAERSIASSRSRTHQVWPSCQRVTFPGNPLSVQAYTADGRNIQNGRNGGSSASSSP